MAVPALEATHRISKAHSLFGTRRNNVQMAIWSEIYFYTDYIDDGE